MFLEIARRTKGAHCQFDPSSADAPARPARYASGGLKALSASQNASAVKHPATEITSPPEAGKAPIFHYATISYVEKSRPHWTACIYGRPHTYIGPILDPNAWPISKLLISLALPRGRSGRTRKVLKNKHKSASLLRECYHLGLPPGKPGSMRDNPHDGEGHHNPNPNRKR